MIDGATLEKWYGKPPPRPRPGYRSAIEWIASNDDNYWTEDAAPMLSVTAAMVVDLWGVEEGRVIADIKRAWTRKFSGASKTKE